MADQQQPRSRHPFLTRAALASLIVLLDLGLVAIVALAWHAQRLGQVDSRDTAALSLLGGSAAFGVVIVLILVAANLAAAGPVAAGPAAAGRRLASAGLLLAWLRPVGILAAVAATAAVLGADTVAGLTESFTVALALLDAVAAIAVASVTARAVRATR